MPRWIISIVCVTFTATAHADEKPKPNTLTPKEIEEGWILLFDGETTFGWKTEGDVKVEGGELHIGGAKQSSISTSSVFGPCEIRFEYFLKGKAKQSVAFTEHSFPNNAEYAGHWMEMSIDIESKRVSGFVFLGLNLIDVKASFDSAGTMMLISAGDSSSGFAVSAPIAAPNPWIVLARSLVGLRF